ncbi:MAG: hypothetical protein ABEI74_00065 [Candidatus Pacearchaeota archaeon]
MKVKTKKVNKDGVARLEAKGEIKEVEVNEDFLHPDDASLAICFKGEGGSSGIVEMSPKELESLYHEVEQRLHLLKGVKVMKFPKGSSETSNKVSKKSAKKKK